MYVARPLMSPVLVVDGRSVTERQQARALAKMRMARSTKAPHAPEMKIPSSRRSTFQRNTEAELDVALRELSSDTAPGDDEVNCEELEQLGRETKKCVVRLFNCSLRTGQVPAKRGHDIIVPLLKPSKPASSMASFLPVTLKGTLRKLMECIAARRVRDCIEDKLQPQRAVFRPARSTLDTLMQVTSAVRRRKGGEKTAPALIDCARAFDSADHGCIVKVLLSFGCCEAFGCVDRGFSAGAHGAGEGEQHAVGGCQPHLWCPSGLGAGTAAVHCHGGFAEQAAQLHPWAAARVLRGRPHNCARVLI
ncbi:hypothetical protein, conserved [Trypanosoma vivax Y486]|uniref:Reverse transcriptase domain-containing protein n=1 Tax=Trypanosoma vivax (strain Y486) TaxID=1055687 RepID=F9WVT8_TRYVY|nr:hypothetical protein, conserved [Trypanosoma vivax Y486]|eukprot:CCD21699.1 hypothetical protein, conserved [Trypanosoma vivax Y486]